VSRRGRHGREERYAHGRHGRRERYARRGRRYEPRETVAATYSRPGASGIPTERVTEIQNALIKSGYLAGPASGQYDDATSSAMRRFQSANGMQATGLPSAAALKRLGVSKGSNDGYAVPIKSATQRDSSPPPAPDAAKPKP
jgi:peptidoglycan hydrolase-like protein with peptidoglycan-binding domain